MLRTAHRVVAACFMSVSIRRALPILLLSGFAGTALAQSIPLVGGSYTQDFDTLSNTAGSTTNSTLPTGWLISETGGGARDNEQYAVDTGASNTGDTFSYGAAASTERALGSLRSGTLIASYGACFSNSTGSTLTSFDVAYTGEQWRLGTAARTDRLDFQYSLDATSLTTGTWVDVNQVISELVRMSLDTLFLPNKVNVQIDLDPGMGSIVTQRDQLKQVLLNLAKNAVEAMPRGGKLTFATTRNQHGGRDCAVIAVQDTGPGLPQQVREQLFRPAVSTKGGDHAGLGLYISHSLVIAMGGEIEYDSDTSGSTFRIYLPMADMGHNQAAQQPGSQRK